MAEDIWLCSGLNCSHFEVALPTACGRKTKRRGFTTLPILTSFFFCRFSLSKSFVRIMWSNFFYFMVKFLLFSSIFTFEAQLFSYMQICRKIGQIRLFLKRQILPKKKKNASRLKRNHLFAYTFQLAPSCLNLWTFCTLGQTPLCKKVQSFMHSGTNLNKINIYQNLVECRFFTATGFKQCWSCFLYLQRHATYAE